MIVVRDVFRMKFGKAKDVKALMQESNKMMPAEMLAKSRVLFDLVGPSYTMVLESSHKNLAEFEASIGAIFSNKDWQNWYSRFTPLIEQSYREIFSILE